MLKPLLEKQLREHEGRSKKAYRDSRGILTVGVGFNLEQPGAKQFIEAKGINYDLLCNGEIELTDAQIESIFNSSVAAALVIAKRAVKDLDSHHVEVQLVIVNMVFQLGYSGFKKFKKTIKALDAHDYKSAASEMKSSLWYKQTPNRAKEQIAIVLKHAVK